MGYVSTRLLSKAPSVVFALLFVMSALASGNARALQPPSPAVQFLALLTLAALSALAALLLLRPKYCPVSGTAPILLSLTVFTILILAGAWMSGFNPASTLRIVTWAPAPLLFVGAALLGRRVLRESLIFSIPFLIWWCFWIENPNISSMLLLSLPLLIFSSPGAAMPLAAAIGVYCFFVNRTQSVLVAMPFAFVALHAKRHRVLATAFAAATVALIVYVRMDKPDFFQGRDQLLNSALTSYSNSFLLGGGPQAYAQGPEGHAHSHCFPATVAAETGLLGVLCLAWCTYGVAKRWNRYDYTTKFYILLIAFWSLVDEPLQWGPVNFLFFTALGGSAEKDPGHRED